MPGEYFVNKDPKAFKKLELLSLTLHEANPGHHYQAGVFDLNYKG